MATENINVQTGAENRESKPHSWINTLTEKIQKLDTEFPLSGGETEEDFESADDKEYGNDGNRKKTSFFDDLDTEFPLSGGEIDR